MSEKPTKKQRKTRLRELEEERRQGMLNIEQYHNNIFSCHKMTEQNEVLIKLQTEALQINAIELLELQSDFQFENDVACENFIEKLNKAKLGIV